jgi:hypothetical protein
MECGVTKVRQKSNFGPTEVTDRNSAPRSLLKIRTLPPRFRPARTLANRRTLHPSRFVAGLALCATAVALAACGSGTSPAATATTAHQATSTLTTQPPTGAAASALAAYRAMWADMVIASRTSNYQSPLLAESASGDALSVLVQGLAKNQQQGIVTKGEPILHPQVTSLTPAGSPTQATISDCFDDTHWLEYKSSGGLVNNTPGGHRATTAIVMNVGGTWKVDQLAVQATGTC